MESAVTIRVLKDIAEDRHLGLGAPKKAEPELSAAAAAMGDGVS